MPELELKGVVEAVYEDEKGYTLAIGGRRYRAWGKRKPAIEEGDTVLLTYESIVKGDQVYDNIVKPPTKVEAPTVPPMGAESIYTDERDRKISRLSIFTSLCNFYARSGKSIDEIIGLLKKVERELFGPEP